MKYGSAPFEEANKMVVRINSINLDDFIAVGFTNRNSKIEINLINSISGVVVIPAINEQWIIERSWTGWILFAKLPSQNSLLVDPLSVGETRIGALNKLSLSAPVIKVTSREQDAVLSPTVTGFLKLKALATGEVYCWGELNFTTVSVSSASPVTLGTFKDFEEPNFQISPATRRIFTGITTVTESPVNPAVMMKLERFTTTSTTIAFYTSPNLHHSQVYFSTSWHVDQ